MHDTRDDEPAATPLAPGEQPDKPLFAPSTLKLARRAVLLWLALALWLAGLQWWVLGEPPAPGALLRRLGELALPSALFLAAPVLFIPPAVWVSRRRRLALGFEFGCNIGLVAFMGTALAWAGVGLVYALDRTDPWEHIPWVTPPYLEAFIAAHPDIEVHKLNGVRDVHISHRSEGGWMAVDGNWLAGSQARFEGCGTPPAAEELGGLTLPPGASCLRVLTLTRPGAQQRVIYQFGLVPADELDVIARHYTGWAQTRELQAGFSGGTRRYEFRAEQGDRQWDLWLSKRRGLPGVLYVERGGRALMWPE
jgi:hypothetical protein